MRSNTPNPLPTHPFAVLACLLLAILTVGSGCVRRRLTVRTNPPGAQVFVDNQEVGTSPVSTSFVYYGTREIRLLKDGYETQVIHERILPPWYEIPPLEFVSENLWPGETRDERVVDVQMVPMQIVPEQQLLDRADSLRDGVRAGQVTSLPGTASGFLRPNASSTNTPAAGNQPLFGFPGQGLNGLPPAGSAPLPPVQYPPINGSPATSSNNLLQPAAETSRSNWRRLLQIF